MTFSECYRPPQPKFSFITPCIAVFLLKMNENWSETSKYSCPQCYGGVMAHCKRIKDHKNCAIASSNDKPNAYSLFHLGTALNNRKPQSYRVSYYGYSTGHVNFS